MADPELYSGEGDMASAGAREREPITGVLRRSPQRGPGAEPLVRGSGGPSPPEAEKLFSLERPKEGLFSALFVLSRGCGR